MTNKEIKAEAVKMMGLFVGQIHQTAARKQEHVTIGCVSPETEEMVTETHVGEEAFAHNIPCPDSHPQKVLRFHTHPMGTHLFSGGDIAGNLYDRVQLDCIGYPIEEGKGQIRCVQRREHIDQDAEEQLIDQAAYFQNLCTQWAEMLRHIFPLGPKQKAALDKLNKQLEELNDQFHKFVEDVSLVDKRNATIEFNLKPE